MSISTADRESGGVRARLDALPLAAAVLTYVLVAVASFLPAVRLWGFNHLAFYPVHVRLIALGLAGAAFIPQVGKSIHKALASALRRLHPGRVHARAALAGAAVASTGLFWFSRSSTLLLGDARLVASNFEHAFDPQYAVVVGSPRIILLHEHLAKGTSLLYYYAARISLGGFGASPVVGIRLVNCILGGLLVFILLRTVSRKTAAGGIAVWTMMLALTSGAMELYFGYVENYGPLVFFGLLYVLSAVAYLRSPRPGMLAAAFACLLLAAFMHIEGILLAPSFGFLLAPRSWGTGRKGLGRLAALIAAATALGAFLVSAFSEYGAHVLPVLGHGDAFGMLSPSHLADMANEIMLILPAAIVVAAIGGMMLGMRGAGWVGSDPRGVRPRRNPGRRDLERNKAGAGWVGSDPRGVRPRRNPERNAMLYFELLVFFPCMLFLFAFKPDLGMARDWDLFAVTALGLLPLALGAIARAMAAGLRRPIEAATGPTAALCAVLACAWIGVNADPERSARRFEAVLEYDLTRAPYAYEVLAQHYRHDGDLDRAIEILRNGISLSQNLRLVSLAASFHDERGDAEEAVRLYRQVLASRPEVEGPRRNLAILLHRLGRRDELLEVSREGVRYHPGKPIYHYFYGLCLIDAGEVTRGIEELLACRQLRPGPDVTANIDRVLKSLKAAGYDVGGLDSPTGFRLPGRK